MLDNRTCWISALQWVRLPTYRQQIQSVSLTVTQLLSKVLSAEPAESESVEIVNPSGRSGGGSKSRFVLGVAQRGELCWMTALCEPQRGAREIGRCVCLFKKRKIRRKTFVLHLFLCLR